MTTSKIQMDQIRSTSATVTDENIRAGSQKKSSLSPAEGLQGASPDATCTCPSGGGSLRHPCPAHPAVEQAGGDEREEFEAWMHTFDLPPQLDGETFADERYLEAACFGQFVYDDPLTQRCWAAWQARAALAQPSPVSEALIYACKNLAQITSSDGSGHADIAMAVLRMAGVGDDERERLVNEWKAARAWKPALAPAEKAEAERPEVVARVVHSNPVVLDHCGPLNANDELMTVAQHAASVARWAEMFNRVEQERDAALARVAELEAKLAELEKQDLVDVPGPDEIHQMAFEEGQPAEDGDGYLFSAEEFDLFVQRLLDSCAAPVAQAQHSVPEEFIGRLSEFLAQRGATGKALLRELRTVLAAAPGKEVPQAWLDVQAERRRQIIAEGWTPEHDDKHNGGELADAAACYALWAGGINPGNWREFWPWPPEWLKHSEPRRMLVKAGALILAEIQRLDRAAAAGKEVGHE
ncbi:hypothetical protein OKBPHCKP_00035 [Pseudomonas phage LPPA33]|nr:hypothetical protein OKBPHCKP_00035 [Pseudomonas phage LPPA33]